MSALPPDQPAIDFDTAQLFLTQAREAHAKGDEVECFAARKMVALALGLTDGPLVKIHTKHLQARASG